MANAPASPFAGLMTPQTLSAARRAERAERYADQPFWLRRVAEYGSDLQDELIAQDIGLSDQDITARRNSRMMQELSTDVNERLETGELTPEQAQRYMVESAMKAFVSMGDYEQAAQLAPVLRQITAEEEEIAKIRSEIGENQAQAGQADAAALRQLTDAERLAQRTPAEVDLLRAQAEAARRGPVARAGASEAGPYDGTPNKSDQERYENQLNSAAGVFRRMGKLFGVVLGAPGIGGNAATQLAAIQAEAASIAGTTTSTSDALSLKADKAVFDRNAAQREKAYGQLRGRLSIDMARYNSLTMDLAYTLAKARDPGGRLSDADVANALKIIGASGDSQAMARVLQEVAEDTVADLRGKQKTRKWYGEHPGNVVLDEAYQNFLGVVDTYRKPAKNPAKNPAKTAPKSELDTEIDAILGGK